MFRSNAPRFAGVMRNSKKSRRNWIPHIPTDKLGATNICYRETRKYLHGDPYRVLCPSRFLPIFIGLGIITRTFKIRFANTLNDRVKV